MKKFAVDTKGNCFLCLHFNGQPVERSFSFKFLSRYLNLDFRQVFNISSVSFNLSVLENSEIVVPVCENCSVIVEQFADLYEQFDNIKLQLNACVENIHGVMEKGEKKVRSFHDRILKTNTPIDLITVGIVQNLRKETIQKCSLRLKRSYPQIRINKVSNSGPPSDTTPRFGWSDNESKENIPGSGKTVSKRRRNIKDNPGVVVKYKKLQNNKFKCNICSKILRRTNKFYHTRGHQWHQNPKKCPHCSLSFKILQHVRIHINFKHKEMYFQAHKDASTSQENFKALVDKIFVDFNYLKDIDKYKCSFCDTQGFTRKSFVVDHMILHHSDKFVPLIRSLQSDYNHDFAVSQSGQKKKKSDSTTSLTIRNRIEVSSEKTSKIPVDEDLNSGVSSKIAAKKTKNSKEVKVTYKKLRNKRLKCNICSKVVRQRGRYVHARSHQGSGSNAEKCLYCSYSCRESSILQSHNIFKHKDKLFEAYRDPEFTPEKFNNLVNEVFDNFNHQKLAGKYNCSFCDKGGFDRKNYAVRHIIANHFDNVLPLIRTVQSDYLIGFSNTDVVSKDANILSPVPQVTCTSTSCCYCQLQFTNEVYLKAHVFGRHRMELFSEYRSPDETDTVFKEAIKAGIHSFINENRDSKNKLNCKLCVKSYNLSHGLVVHIVQEHFSNVAHALENRSKITKTTATNGEMIKGRKAPSLSQVQCMYCSYTVRDESSLNLHTTKTHKADIFSQYKRSGESKVKFDQRVKTIMYKFIHEDEDRNMDGGNKCRLCVKEYRNPDMLEVHIVQQHFEDVADALTNQVKVTGESLEMVMCDEDEEMVAIDAPDDSIDPLSEITPSSSVKCEYCPSKCKTKEDLKSHMFKRHRVQLFSGYRTPGVTDSEFEKVIKAAIDTFITENAIDGTSKCQLCVSTYRHPYDLVVHISEQHFDELTQAFENFSPIAIAEKPMLETEVDEDAAEPIVAFVVASALKNSTGSCSEIVICDDEDEALVAFDPLDPTVNSLEPFTDNFSLDTMIPDDIHNNSEASTSPSNQLIASNHAEQSTIHKCPKIDEEKPYHCKTCFKRFSRPGNLKTHQLFTHRAEFFQSRKDPRVPFSKFKELVEEVFEKLSFQLDGKHMFQCSFCHTAGFSSRSHIMSHTIQDHSDHFIPLLNTMQSNYLVEMEEIIAVRLSQESELLEKKQSKNKIHACKYCQETAKKALDIHLHIIKHHWIEILSKFRDPSDKDEDSEIKLRKLVGTYVNGLSKINSRINCRICEKTFNYIINAEVHVLQDHMSKRKLELKMLEIRGNLDMGKVVDISNHKAPPEFLAVDNFLFDAIMSDDNEEVVCLEQSGGDDEEIMEVKIES